MGKVLKGPFKKGSKAEKYYYEFKPLLIVFAAVGVLVYEQWGLLNLVAALGILYYAGAILFWRLNHRGSFKKWFSTEDKEAA